MEVLKLFVVIFSFLYRKNVEWLIDWIPEFVNQELLIFFFLFETGKIR